MHVTVRLVTTVDEVDMLENTEVTIAVIENDDPLANASTLSIFRQPENGTIVSVDRENGTVTYRPYSYFAGYDYFLYRVCADGSRENCAIGLVDITVRLLIADDSFTVPGYPKGTVLDILGNDSLTVDATTVCILQPPLHGTFEQNVVNGDVFYLPSPGFAGTDSFTYIACCGCSKDPNIPYLHGNSSSSRTSPNAPASPSSHSSVIPASHLAGFLSQHHLRYDLDDLRFDDRATEAALAQTEDEKQMEDLVFSILLRERRKELSANAPEATSGQGGYAWIDEYITSGQDQPEATSRFARWLWRKQLDGIDAPEAVAGTHYPPVHH